jgi:hypothetical protein
MLRDKRKDGTKLQNIVIQIFVSFEEESVLSVSKKRLINCRGGRLHFVLCCKCKCTNERIII